MNEVSSSALVRRSLLFRIAVCACIVFAGAVIICRPAEAVQEKIVRLGEDIIVEPGVEVDGVVSIGGSVRVYGHVDNDVVSIGGNVFLGEQSVVRGDVISVGGPVVREPGAQVRGRITSVETPRIMSLFSGFDMPDLPTFNGFIPFIGFVLLALCIVALIPSTVGFISYNLEHDTLKTFAWGVLATVLILPLVFVFIASIVGIVLIPVLIILVACAFLLGYVAVCQLVGKKITIAVKKAGRPILLETVLGTVVLAGIGMIPVIGWLIQTVALVAGFGGVIFSIIARRRR